MSLYPSRPLHANRKPSLSRADAWTAVVVAGSATFVSLGAVLLAWAATS